jgi:dihydropyrimidine dehydrogenase (NADP+)
MQSKLKKDIFSGGDIIGTENLVDAVNDGKNASWSIHKYIQGLHGKTIEGKALFPEFTTEIDQVDISTTMAGLKFDNPFGLASAPPATSYPMIKRAFELGWGFAVVKTFSLDKDLVTNISPRIFKATSNPLHTEAAFSNIELISEKTAKYWVEGSKHMKKEFPNKILIGSIMAAPIQKDWEELAEMCDKAGFDAIELNLSCNHGMPDKGMGKACSENSKVVEDITKWVVSRTKKPVFIKMSPNSSINEEIAMAAQTGGATGVTTTNTMLSLMDPTGDGLPYPKVGKAQHTHYGGACGSILRPISLRVAAQVSEIPGFKLEMMATGGIISAEHAMAYLYYSGCKVFQVCSAIQEHDFTIIRDLSTGLRTLLYMLERKDLKKKGWKGQSPPPIQMQGLRKYVNNFDFWGKNEKPVEVDVKKIPALNSLSKKNLGLIHHITDMDVKAQQFPFIQDSLCVNCGKCYLTCLDSAYQAITFDNKTHKPVITKDCTGCGLCIAVCPIPDAIIFRDRPSEYDYFPNRGLL